MGKKFGNMRKLRRDEEEEPGARRDKVEEILAKMSQAEKTAVACFRGDLHEWSDRSEKVLKVADMISRADADGSGSVDFYEFVTLMAHKMASPGDDRGLRNAFALFDHSGDGHCNK